MAFVLLSSPCIAALSVTRKEMGSVKWLLITIAFQMLTAYLVSFILYTLGSLFLFNKWIILIPMISAAVGIIVYAIIKTKAKRRKIINAVRYGNRARSASQTYSEIAAKLGLTEDDYECYGNIRQK